MSATGQFLIYCIEMYRREKCLTGRQTYDLFVQTGADGFVQRCYGALHTTGVSYILSEIDAYIENHRAA